jgi:polyphenol oxidase
LTAIEPKPSDGSSTLMPMPLPVLRSTLLSQTPSVVHGVTGRVVGLTAGAGNVGFGAPRDAADAWLARRAWCDAIGVTPESLVAVRQVHGAAVVRVTRDHAGRGAAPGSEPLGFADAIVTADAGVTPITLHADCLPILLCDPEVPAVASIHAGWRGTAAGIAAAAVRDMELAYDARPERTIAYLGPANLACCYQVGEEVVEAWLKGDPSDQARAVVRTAIGWRFDVAAANRWTLIQVGLAPERIELSHVCTQCGPDRWFSHRAQGAHTGRFAAAIALTGRREP